MIDKIKVFTRENRNIVCVAAVTALLYTITGITFHSQFLNLLPLYISLVVMLLQSSANRYAFLLGAINCVVYTLVYLYMGLYGSLISTLFFSCPIQFITFLRWSKKAYKQSTIFRRMTGVQLMLVSLGTLLVWGIFYAALIAMNSSHSLLDSMSNIFSVVATLLCMFSFVEYGLINLVTCVSGLAMMIVIAVEDSSYVPWVISNMYSTICVFRGYLNMKKLYREQQSFRQSA